MVLMLAFKARGHEIYLPPKIILPCSSPPKSGGPSEPPEPTHSLLPSPSEWSTPKSINCVFIQQIFSKHCVDTVLGANGSVMSKTTSWEFTFKPGDGQHTALLYSLMWLM